jgi:hypothetical protein
VAEGTALAETVAMAQRAAAGSAKAIRETKRLLGAIDDGTTDLAPWEPVRLDFLRSPERAAAIEAAKTRRTAR